MLAVAGLIRVQDSPQVGLVPDEGAVRSSRRHPPIQRSAIAFMRDVATLQSTVRMPALARTGSNSGGEVRAAVADHELDPVCLFAGVHEEVAGLPGCSLPRWDGE